VSSADSPTSDDRGIDIAATGSVLSLTITRPERMGALHATMLGAAADALESPDPSVRAVVLRGSGRAFSSGADLRDTRGGVLAAANRLIRAMVGTPLPVVAIVNGPAVGLGCSLALAADIAIASETAYFRFPFVDLALVPDGGVTVLAAAAVGRARATRLMLTAETLSASAAAQIGLIAEVCAADQLDERSGQVLSRLAQGAPAAYAEAKRLMREATLRELDAALERELTVQMELKESVDHQEAVAAFREGRAARFAGPR
jgi:enoyl-CoA hydratase/carnithine racemase